MSYVLGFIVFWILAASVARFFQHQENRRLHRKTQGYLEAEALITEREVKRLELLMKQAEAPRLDPPPPMGSRRVYGALMKHANEYCVFLAPAESVQEASVQARAALGELWSATSVTYVDVWPPAERVVYRNPTKTQQKEMNIEQGYYFLQMAKDKYADGEAKKALDSVISNYKKEHAI